VLKAILAFDKTRDRINSGEHLEFSNKYSTNPTENSEVSALLTLDDAEIKKLIADIKVRTNSCDYKYISTWSADNTFLLTRKLSDPNKPYYYANKNLSTKSKERIQKFLTKHLPYILYFDDFADRVPQEISFPYDYNKTGNLTRNKQRDWQEIIEEIFKRADTEGIKDDANPPLVKYLNITNPDTKADILSDVEQTLNREIIEEWKRIKKSGGSFADDSDKLQLALTYEKNTFFFKVKDMFHDGKSRTFNVTQRSKGFQWFFNYMIKLKFNPNYKGKLENSIFLLDEPGSYLHSSAQSELLKELEQVSKNNYIVYCTHSQYLLNPKTIKLGSIKIVEKVKSCISLQSFGEYKTSKNKSALSPIYQALQLNFAHDFIGKIVITEGVTDYYLLTLIQQHTSKIDNEIKIIPSSGAGQSSTLISIAIPFSDNYLILLDNDRAGKSAKKKYLKEFGDGIKNNIHLYHEEKNQFLLEDFLCGEDKEKLQKATGAKDLKKAFGFLFYDLEKEVQKDFILKLSSKSSSLLSNLIKRINDL